jgi:hypothetical protein
LAPTTSTTTTTLAPTTTCGYCFDENDKCSKSIFECQDNYGNIKVKLVSEIPDKESNKYWILN